MEIIWSESPPDEQIISLVMVEDLIRKELAVIHGYVSRRIMQENPNYGSVFLAKEQLNEEEERNALQLVIGYIKEFAEKLHKNLVVT